MEKGSFQGSRQRANKGTAESNGVRRDWQGHGTVEHGSEGERREAGQQEVMATHDFYLDNRFRENTSIFQTIILKQYSINTENR